jgi:GNAT superfamily N-acetyltransferase
MRGRLPADPVDHQQHGPNILHGMKHFFHAMNAGKSGPEKYEIREVGPEWLHTYAKIPISFNVESILRIKVLKHGMGGFKLIEEKVTPFIKDYDRLELAGEGPLAWAKEFDVRGWGFLIALFHDIPYGAATIAVHTPGVLMLEGRQDLAVLWDLRVHPQQRGKGIGRKLFKQSMAWARARGCNQMKIETQNINVPACRFYARMGCELGAIHRHAYRSNPDLTKEIMLLWYIDL